MPRKLTEEEVATIKTLTDHGVPTRDIVKLTGRSETSVQIIRNGTRDEKLAKALKSYHARKHPDDDTQEEMTVEPAAPKTPIGLATPNTDFEDRLIAVLESIRDELHTLAIALS